MEQEEQRSRACGPNAQQDFNAKKESSGIGLYNTAAALDQSLELFNPEAALKPAAPSPSAKARP